MPPRKGTKGQKSKAAVPSPPDSPVSKASKAVEHIAEHLDLLYEPSESLAKQLTESVKDLYDHAKSKEPALLQVSSSLPSLIVEGFESEQIWEQLKLQMDPLLKKIEKRMTYFTTRAEKYEQEQEEKEKLREEKVKQLEKKMEKKSLAPEEAEEAFDFEEDEDGEIGFPEDEDMFDMNEDDELPNFDEDIYGNDDDDDDDDVKKALREMEDGFFDWEEMERFADIGEDENNTELIEADRQARRRQRILNGELEEDEEEEDEEDVDLSATIEGASNVRYEDFFLPPNEAKIYKAKMAKKRAANALDNDETDFFSGTFGKTASKTKTKTVMDADSDEEADMLDDKQDNDVTFQGPGQSATDYEINDEEHVADHLLSSFEKKQLLMQKQIDAIEQQLVGPKAWDQGGETRAHMRDTDDLLTKHLDIEYAMRSSAPVTEEVALEIEEIIRYRCKQGVFDDVQRRIPPAEKPFTPKEEVSAEKSKYGLAEIYEKEYLQAALGTESEVATKLSKEHEEIGTLFASICHKLDALSNFHFTPKMPTQELTITSSTPAIQMEEMLPMGVSDAQRMAPQEVFQASTGGLLAAKSEQTRDEKLSARKARQEKKKKHFTVVEQQQKDAAAGGDKRAAKKLQEKDYAKTYKDATKHQKVTRAVNADSTKYATSTQFFTKVQEEQQRDQSGIQRPKKSNVEKKKSVGSYMG